MGNRTVTFCDRCGREGNDVVPIMNIGISIVKHDPEDATKSCFSDTCDLCPACKDILIDTIMDVLYGLKTGA